MSTNLTRRLFTTGLVLAPTFAAAPAAFAQGLSRADQATVDRAVSYLENLTRAKGRFTQIDPRGRRASGDIYLQRPGKIRFEFDPPADMLYVSDGNQVAIQDNRLGTLERYPLASTPLALFLSRQIRLDRGVRVTDVSPTDGGFEVTARDGTGETAGQLIMSFADGPMALRGWTIVDPRRQRTEVRLSSLQRVASLDPDLFQFDVERRGSRRP
jgi:outer membrane lipoprotein-sorting protein